MPSVAEIAKKLNREFKDEKLAIKADVTPTYERMPTGAFGFDYPLYGGIGITVDSRWFCFANFYEDRCYHVY